MSTSKKIEFDLVANATDSLRQAVETLAWKESGDDHSRLKHAIGNAAHAIELLLKEKLRRINPAFVWENVDKYPSLDARTVTVDTAISRLSKIGGITFSAEDKDLVASLRNTRNAIEHYEWSTTESEARIIVGRALSFAFAFGRDELGIDFSDQFKGDDTWGGLLDNLREFARVHGARIQLQLHKQGRYPVCCDSCGELTVPMFGGSCELCGHWQGIEDT